MYLWRCAYSSFYQLPFLLCLGSLVQERWVNDWYWARRTLYGFVNKDGECNTCFTVYTRINLWIFTRHTLFTYDYTMSNNTMWSEQNRFSFLFRGCKCSTCIFGLNMFSKTIVHFSIYCHTPLCSCVGPNSVVAYDIVVCAWSEVCVRCTGVGLSSLVKMVTWQSRATHCTLIRIQTT